jgi:hypothetical protein
LVKQAPAQAGRWAAYARKTCARRLTPLARILESGGDANGPKWPKIFKKFYAG